ncbi:MAG: LytR C-terminal domain-containing protein [Deltaproteobacteria bacterium]|jgi:hypothetical protein|nr:LytR C-terminal domain-containing protein [Deltaproteobacteria bacterium]
MKFFAVLAAALLAISAAAAAQEEPDLIDLFGAEEAPYASPNLSEIPPAAADTALPALPPSMTETSGSPASAPSPYEPLVPAEAQGSATPPDPAAATAQTASEPPTDYRVGGSVLTPPPPAWQRESRETAAGVPSADGKLPDFDASHGRWQQMEVGQFDRPRNAGPDSVGGVLSPPPSYNAPVSAGNGQNAPARTSSARPPAENQERAELRQLFSDLQPPSSSVPVSADNGQNAPARTSPARPSADNQERAELRQLFSDLLPEASSSDEAAGAPGAPGSEGFPPAPPVSAAQSASVAQPAPAPPAASRPAASAEAEPAEAAQASPKASADDAASAARRPTAAVSTAADPTANGPAIGRAGSLLTEQSLQPKVGNSGVLTTGETDASDASGESATGRRPAEPPKSAAKTVPSTAAKPSDAKSPAATSAGSAKAPASARPNLSLALVNETGRPQVGESYRAVLSAMGYQVVSVTQAPAGGAPNQTIVAYRPGRQGQASTLARHLPGALKLRQADGSLPAEAVVTIR